MRTRATIASELHHAQALAEHAADEYDNDGQLVRTAAQRRAIYRRQAARLQGELDTLDTVINRSQS